MKHPAKFDHSEDPADLVFNQSNLKTVFSKAQLGWKLSFPGWPSVSRSSTLKHRRPILRGEERAPRKFLEGSAEKLRAELLAEKPDMMRFGLKTRMTRWMVRCNCFLKNDNLLNPRRLEAIPGCDPWTWPVWLTILSERFFFWSITFQF